LPFFLRVAGALRLLLPFQPLLRVLRSQNVMLHRDVPLQDMTILFALILINSICLCCLGFAWHSICRDNFVLIAAEELVVIVSLRFEVLSFHFWDSS